MENKVVFYYTSALVAVVQQAKSGNRNLSSDFFDGIKLWNRVRLG
jgi:hypothetical protein